MKKQYNLYLTNLQKHKNKFIRHYGCTEKGMEPLTQQEFKSIYDLLANKKMDDYTITIAAIEMQSINTREELKRIIQ